MGELKSLLLILALIYLSECVVWVRRSALVFATWWGKNFRILHPGTVLGNQRGGLLFANPLPPLGTTFISTGFPLSLSPEGAFAYSAACLNPAGRPSQTARSFRFEELRDVAFEGGKVLVNGEMFLKAASTISARHWASSLRGLRNLPKTARADAIRKLIHESLDADQIARRVRELQWRVKPIRHLSNALFIYLFLVLAPLLWRYGFGQFGLWLLLGMLAQTVSIAVLFRRAHQALYPGADEERFKPFFTMLLAPPTAIRAPDIFARHLLETFHPLAVAKVLCRPETFTGFARLILLDLRYPLLPVCPMDDPSAVLVEQWFRAAQREAIEKFIQSAGLRPDELIAPPKPSETASQSYCPRCGAQFVVHAGYCADCGGRPVQPFGDIEALKG